jgi:hypothetical protein
VELHEGPEHVLELVRRDAGAGAGDEDARLDRRGVAVEHDRAPGGVDFTAFDSNFFISCRARGRHAP